MIAQTQIQKLKEVVDYFFENPHLNELYLKFSEPIVLTRHEYKEIIGIPDSTNGAENDIYVLDQFVYDEEDELVKMNVRYTKEDEDKLLISEIMIWREVKGSHGESG